MKNEKRTNEDTTEKLKFFQPTGVQTVGSPLKDHLTRFDSGSNAKFFVYIPDVIMDVDNKTHYFSFKSHVTRDADGGFYNHTCIYDITGEAYTRIENTLKRVQGDAYADLGYTGDCPLCMQMGNVWRAYNKKCNAALANHDSAKHDTVIPEIRRQMVDMMPIHSNKEYVAFPIVLIPRDTDCNVPPALDWLEKCEILMVVWSKTYYDRKITQTVNGCYGMPSLELGGYTRPTGVFWTWFFTTHTDTRLTMRDAVYLPLTCEGLNQEKAHLDVLVTEYLKVNSDTLLASVYVPLQILEVATDTLMLETSERRKDNAE